MGLAKFYFFSTVGILIWNTLWISIGLNLGENWQAAEEFASFLDWVVYALLVFVAGYVIINFIRQVSKR
jgi:membrane protein DedA with SNARE-associated domain